MFTRGFLVAEPNHQYLQGILENENAHFIHMEAIERNFTTPSCQKQFIRENVSNNAPIRRIVVAMNIN